MENSLFEDVLLHCMYFFYLMLGCFCTAVMCQHFQHSSVCACFVLHKMIYV